MAARKDDAFAARQAVDDHVEKAAHAGACKEEENGPSNVHAQRPFWPAIPFGSIRW